MLPLPPEAAALSQGPPAAAAKAANPVAIALVLARVREETRAAVPVLARETTTIAPAVVEALVETLVETLVEEEILPVEEEILLPESTRMALVEEGREQIRMLQPRVDERTSTVDAHPLLT